MYEYCPRCNKNATYIGSAVNTRSPQHYYRCDNGCKATVRTDIKAREPKFQFVVVEHPEGGEPIEISEVW